MHLGKETQRFFDAILNADLTQAEEAFATGKAEINALKDGLGLLHVVCSVGDLEGVRYLLRKGVEVNTRDHHGRTALFHSLLFPECLSLLLEAGADPNLLDAKGQTVLAYAQGFPRRQVARSVELLEAQVLRGASPKSKKPKKRPLLPGPRGQLSQEAHAFLASLGLEAEAPFFSELYVLGTLLLLEGELRPFEEAKALWQRASAPAHRARWSCFLTTRSLADVAPTTAEFEADLNKLDELKGAQWFEQARKRVGVPDEKLHEEFGEKLGAALADALDDFDESSKIPPPPRWDAPIRQASPRLGALREDEPGPDLRLVLYRGGPEFAPILYRFGGWNDAPAPAEQGSVLRSWHERFGVQVAFIWDEVLELTVAAPPDTREKVEAAALEASLFYSGTLSPRANFEMVRSTCWFFWWD